MSTDTKVTFHKGGTQEKTVEVKDIVIPDLWHIHRRMVGEALKTSLETREGRLEREWLNREAQAVLDCWHLAHGLKDHIQNAP